MHSLVRLLNEHTPIFAPFGRIVVIAGLFAVAWVVSRLAGRAAAVVVDRSERRHLAEEGIEDTGVIRGLRQRQTAISLVQAGSVRLRTAVAPGREWLADDFLPNVIAERAEDGLIVHGPVVMPADEDAVRRFARAAYSRTSATPARSSSVSRSSTDSSRG